MRERCDQRDELKQILKSGKVKGFMTIHALLTKDNEIHVFPDAQDISKDIALMACELAISSLYEKKVTVQ